MNFITPKMKNIFIRSVSYGFVSGFTIGCCFSNTIIYSFENKYKKYNSSLYMPFITGTMCSMGIIFSPLIMINYFCNGVYFDKVFDKLIDNYDINIERFHQYGAKDNDKYAFPSLLVLSIKSKNKNN
jgi:hypothetical protein